MERNQYMNAEDDGAAGNGFQKMTCGTSKDLQPLDVYKDLDGGNSRIKELTGSCELMDCANRKITIDGSN